MSKKAEKIKKALENTVKNRVRYYADYDKPLTVLKIGYVENAYFADSSVEERLSTLDIEDYVFFLHESVNGQLFYEGTVDGELIQVPINFEDNKNDDKIQIKHH